jgi:hypothetical protein
MSTTITATTTLDIAQLDRLASDAQGRLAELETDEARLSLDALTDEDAARELKNVQSERASALAAIRQAEMARAERDRREIEAAEAAEQERVAACIARARELQPQIEKSISVFDKKLLEAAKALADYCEMSTEQQQELSRAGERPPRMPQWAGNGAIAYALGLASVPRGIVGLEAIPTRPQPLSQSHPNPALGEAP